MNARALFAVSALSFVAPIVAAAQGPYTSVSLHGAVGTHINAGGDSQSVSVGFSPNDRFDLLVSAERSHRPTATMRFDATRGGTTMSISGEVRFLPFTLNRISPYVLASAGGGISRPNVNDMFPESVTRDVWLLLFFGGGVRLPVTKRLSAFTDVRFGVQGELDTIFLLLPVRGGVAWRF